MKANEFIIEADRVGTAMWRNSIPEKYKKFPIIGQGATSVVLDKGDDNVLVLTRDAMKKDWLVQTWGLGLGKWIDSFAAHHQKSRDIGDMPVLVIEMPKLYPLSLENKRIIKKSIEQYYAVVGYEVNQKIVYKFNKYLETYPNGLFSHLVDFLQNYDVDQYSIDFLIRNFMQDKNNEIVLIDPIVSRDIIIALNHVILKKYNRT